MLAPGIIQLVFSTAQTARETNVLTLRGGLLEGKTLTGAEVDRLATLPPVDVLRGQLVGAIVAPATQLLALLSAPLQDLRGVLEARIEQLGGTSAEAEVGDAEEASAATSEAAAEPGTDAGELTLADSAPAESPQAESPENQED